MYYFVDGFSILSFKIVFFVIKLSITEELSLPLKYGFSIMSVNPLFCEGDNSLSLFSSSILAILFLNEFYIWVVQILVLSIHVIQSYFWSYTWQQQLFIETLILNYLTS